MLNDSLGFRITITATNPIGDGLVTSYASPDPNVFRYTQLPANSAGVQEQVFSGVCSWPDYLELPISAPLSDTFPGNFRLYYIDLVVESETVANEIWNLVVTQVNQLMQTIQDGNTLTSAGTITCTSQ